MRPDRRGKSKWVKVLPWYYTRKRKRSRSADRRDAVRVEIDSYGRPEGRP